MNNIGTWNLRAARSASGGHIKYANTSGAMARFPFAGRNVAWIAPTGPDRGKAEVWVGGVKAKTVDLYSSSAQPRKMVFTKSWGSSRSHTLEIRVLGKKNFIHGQAGGRGHLCIVALGKGVRVR